MSVGTPLSLLLLCARPASVRWLTPCGSPHMELGGHAGSGCAQATAATTPSWPLRGSGERTQARRRWTTCTPLSCRCAFHTMRLALLPGCHYCPHGCAWIRNCVRSLRSGEWVGLPLTPLTSCNHNSFLGWPKPHTGHSCGSTLLICRMRYSWLHLSVDMLPPPPTSPPKKRARPPSAEYLRAYPHVCTKHPRSQMAHMRLMQLIKMSTCTK